eukprot:11195061-Lingulodinium_polyedra.AAC.1
MAPRMIGASGFRSLSAADIWRQVVQPRNGSGLEGGAGLTPLKARQHARQEGPPAVPAVPPHGGGQWCLATGPQVRRA